MGGQQTKKSNASVGKYLIHGARFGLGKYEYVYIFFSLLFGLQADRLRSSFNNCHQLCHENNIKVCAKSYVYIFICIFHQQYLYLIINFITYNKDIESDCCINVIKKPDLDSLCCTYSQCHHSATTTYTLISQSVPSPGQSECQTVGKGWRSQCDSSKWITH